MIKELLMQDLKAAMRDKDVVKKSTVIMLRAAIKQVEVDTRVELADQDVIEIIQKQIKQKKAALEEFMKASREDLINETEAEIAILMDYLPEQLTVEELRKLVSETIKEVGAVSMKDMGSVMAAMKDKTSGRADGKTLSTIIKECLSN